MTAAPTFVCSSTLPPYSTAFAAVASMSSTDTDTCVSPSSFITRGRAGACAPAAV